ncbi:MAG: AMIN domain-containing protein, partial [Archangium sp.]|nr:AMIN domain-containing protein [Archangium sp.]
MALSTAAAATDMNTLKAVDVSATPSGAQIVLRGSHPPTFSVFRLNDPDRLVIDLANTSTANVKGHHDGAGPAVGIVASQFSNARSEVGRVLIGLEGLERYDVRARDNDLVVALEGAARVQPAPVAEVAPETAPAAELVAAAAEPTTAAPPSADNDVIDTRIDEIAVANPAHTLKGVRWSNRTLRLLTDGPVAKFELTTLQNPPRLAIDLFGVKSSARAPKVSDALVREVRLGASEGKVRVVVEGRDEMPSFSTARTPKGLDVTFRAPVPETASEATVAEIDGKRLVDEERSVEVKGVSFKESTAGGSVDIKVAKDVRWRVERPDASSAVLVLESATMAKSLERSLDTSALGTPVKMVSAFAVPGTQRRVRVVVGASASFRQAVTRTADGLRWELEQSDVEESKLTSNQTAGFATEASEFADEAAPQQRRYVGKRVSFEFKDIDIHNLLRIIAEISKKNLIVSDDVGGRVTIRLRNVPWDQVLDLVLKARGLGKQEYGNIMRVAPMAVFESEAKAAEAIRESRMKSSPLTVQLIPVNYATATDVSARVKEILSPRGNVTVDTRTNTLIVRDVVENMGKVKSLVAVLDTQTPQVLIESRIVEASTTFSREIGIQWGGNALMSAATGNPTGLVFPNSVALIGGVTGN